MVPLMFFRSHFACEDRKSGAWLSALQRWGIRQKWSSSPAGSCSLGLFRYALASILQTIQMPAYNITIQLDNQPPQQRQLTNIMVNNTRHAANYLIFHQACPNDGEMNVLLSDNRFWEQMLENLAVLTRNHTKKFQEDNCSVKSLNLHSPTAIRLMLDGETWDGVNEVSAIVLSKRLRCYFQS
jgi:diacylglycerol kinase family enzyme